MGNKKQHVQIERKLKLRRKLLDKVEVKNIYVPFIGNGDIAKELYTDFKVYGADIEQDRAEEARSRLDGDKIIEADCNEWPFPEVDQTFQAADFDAYSEPYKSFRAFWNNANIADTIALFFTDGHKQGVQRTGHWHKPDGSKEYLESKKEKREVFNFYYPRHIKPWFEEYIGEYKIRDDFKYFRKDQFYWGAVVSTKEKPQQTSNQGDIKPYKFDSNARERVIEHLKDYSVSIACEIEGISRQTYYNHYNDNPEFAAKCDQAKAERDGEVVRSLREAAIAGDTTAMKYWLSTRRPEDWQEKKRREISGPGGEPIKTENDNNAGVELDVGEKARTILEALRAEQETEKDNNES